MDRTKSVEKAAKRNLVEYARKHPFPEQPAVLIRQLRALQAVFRKAGWPAGQAKGIRDVSLEVLIPGESKRAPRIVFQQRGDGWSVVYEGRPTNVVVQDLSRRSLQVHLDAFVDAVVKLTKAK